MKKEQANKEIKHIKGIYKQQTNYIGSSIIVSGILIFLILLVFIFTGGSELSYGKYISGILILALTILIIYFIDYKVTGWLLNHHQNIALKGIKQELSQGKNPYPKPRIFGLMIGLVFVIGAGYFILEFTNWDAFSSKSIIAYVISFIIGDIIGYFAQIRNLSKLKNIK